MTRNFRAAVERRILEQREAELDTRSRLEDQRQPTGQVLAKAGTPCACGKPSEPKRHTAYGWICTECRRTLAVYKRQSPSVEVVE